MEEAGLQAINFLWAEKFLFGVLICGGTPVI
jgi:hypothetical protein